MNGLKVGGHVVFVDSRGVPHDALVTAIHGRTDLPDSPPCINVVRVSDDDTMRDSYGRQVAPRETSVVYRTRQPAHGYYYTLPGEPLNPAAQLQA